MTITILVGNMKEKITKIEVHYDAKCKHCSNWKSNGRGKPSECLIKAKPLYRGKDTPACDKFKF